MKLSLPVKLGIFAVIILAAVIAVFICRRGDGEKPETLRAKQQSADMLYAMYEDRLRKYRSPKILIVKHKRVLVFINKKGERKIFSIGLGFNPEGHKSREGDGRTPEGDYYICTKNPESKYYLSLGISYPGIPDAGRGLEEGAITQKQHDKIVDACERWRCPPWKTALGGEICIHGRGKKGKDWTLGCIALQNADMKYLFDNVPVQTPVVIVP
ncbi:MAG: L,D-transpeptidase family protein [Planctomycetota bacterium]